MIACSRMYNLAPEIKAAWTHLFAWLSDLTGETLEVIDHPAPEPLEALWARPDMGCVFMCGWPYAMADPRPVLLAAPVPAPARYGGRPVYVTDLIVRDDSPYCTLADTFGGRVGWTVEHSHSGFNAPRHHLLWYRTPDCPALYTGSIGPLTSPRRVLAAVIEGEIDVGPIDGFALDLLRRHAPDDVAPVRVVETTAAAPIPPLVASPATDESACQRLRDTLTAAHQASEMETVLDVLMVRRFVAAEPADYAPLLALAKEALDAGYYRPG